MERLLKADPEQVRRIAEEEQERKLTKAQRVALLAAQARATADGRAKAKARRAAQPVVPVAPTPKEDAARRARERNLHNLAHQLRESRDEAEIYPGAPDASHSVEEMREVAGVKRRQLVQEAVNCLGVSWADLQDALGVSGEVLEQYLVNGSSGDTSDGAVKFRRLLKLVREGQLETRNTWLR